MRPLLLALALVVSATAPEAQTRAPSVAEVQDRLQASGLLPSDLSPWDDATSRAELLQIVSYASRPELDLPDSLQHIGIVLYSGSEAPGVLSAFTDSLRASGALSARAYGRLRQRLDPEHPRALTFRFSIADEATRMVQAEEQFSPRPLAVPLDSLVRLGALSPAERKALDARLARGEIESNAAFAGALPTGILVPDPDAGESPEAAARRELRAVADVLRQRGIAALDVASVEPVVVESVDPWRPDDEPVLQYALDLSATIDGQTHRSETFLDFAASRDSIDFAGALHRAVVPVLNKALREAGAAQRLYAIPMDFYERQWTDRVGTAYVALTEAQAEVASTQPWQYRRADIEPPARPLALLSPYDLLTADTLTTARTAETVAWLRQTGILADSPDLTERLAALDRAYITSPHHLLETLGLAMPFDWEMGDTDTPYLTLLADLARASSGRFAPEAVESRFDWDARVADLAFTLGGTRYAADLEFNGDWYDSDAFTLIVRALREQASGARLYSTVYGRYDDGSPIAGDEFWVLTEAQAEAINARGWVEIVDFGPRLEEGD